MATNKLTDTTCKNAKPRQKPYKLADGNGLYLEVMPHGSKLWRLKYRLHGKEKRLALGNYPEISLIKARKERDAARELVREGKDPSFAKQEKKRLSKISAQHTFEATTLKWHEYNKTRWTPKHGEDILHRLKKDIFPVIGSRPISTITPPQILDAVRKIEDRGAHELARRALQYCGQVFRYAVQEGYLDSDPTRDLKGATKPYQKGHYRALEAEDLPSFLKAIKRNDARLYPATIRATQLLLLTFVRTSELIQAKWEEIDFANATWSIPAGRMKMRRPHIVPLSTQAAALFKEQKELAGKSAWVFPNQSHPKKSMSNGTILGAIRRLGYKEKTTGHGFRALAMTTLKEKLGYRHEVVDRQLAHGHKNRVDAAYDRAQFLPERREMMQRWADYLDNASTQGNVIVGNFPENIAA